MQDCDLILYQAGADPHIDDPLGGWLTTEQLFERDRRVFQSAHALGIPVAWNLAGGYQTPLRQVWDMNFDSDTNVVDVAIRRLRLKVDEPFAARLIHSVRGAGYVLDELH